MEGRGSQRQVAMDDMIEEMSRNTNGTGQLIGDLAAVLEKYECHSPLLIQLLEHKHGCGRSVKNVRVIQLSVWRKEELTAIFSANRVLFENRLRYRC